MYQGKMILALIAARGGSKGLPGKNIRLLGDKPLIAWSIDAATNSEYIDRLIVSTDDKEIAGTAEAFGAEVPFFRPVELASDTAKMMDVIMHAMDHVEQKGGKYDYLVLLQPTSPFRTAVLIDQAIELLFNKKGKVVLGVTEVQHSPLRTNVLPDDGNMGEFYSSKLENFNRQEMSPYYRLNGAIYVADWTFMKENKKWLSKDTYAYIMDRRSSIDIDDLEDFLLAEVMLDRFGKEVIKDAA